MADHKKRYNAIRKELKELILLKQKNCVTDKERNNAVNEARSEINLKYGHEWRNGQYH